MSKKVPDDIAKEIKELVFHEADKVDYLARSRKDNGNFISQLINTPQVGEKLSQYMKKSDVKTYIKDAIINRYAKDKAQKERPNDIKSIIQEQFGVQAHLIDSDANERILLFKSSSDTSYVVVADGTVLKWETALRRALSYAVSKPFFEHSDTSIDVILTLFARHQKVPPSDLRYLKKALSVCNAKPYIYGDG